MAGIGQVSYPGEATSSATVLRLAPEYRRAAETLTQNGRKGDPLSRAPYRLLAIHAIELYLNALLLRAGHGSARIRGLQHDLAARAQLAVEARLPLRRRTLAHLQALSAAREYHATRYDPAAVAASQLTASPRRYARWATK